MIFPLFQIVSEAVIFEPAVCVLPIWKLYPEPSDAFFPLFFLSLQFSYFLLYNIMSQLQPIYFPSSLWLFHLPSYHAPKERDTTVTRCLQVTDLTSSVWMESYWSVRKAHSLHSVVSGRHMEEAFFSVLSKPEDLMNDPGGRCTPYLYLSSFFLFSISGLIDNWCFPSKESACNAGDTGLITRWGRSPGEGNGNLLQYSCLGNPTDRGAWQATVHGVRKSQTWLSN